VAVPPDMRPARAPHVALEGVTRRFGATLANDAVDLTLLPGSIHALVGENGAGKSTLMRVLYGLIRPDAGRILIDGRVVAIASPAVALRHGIGMIHQHFMLVPRMSVLENIALGGEGLRGLRPLPRSRLVAALARLSDAYGFDLDPHACVETLGIGERQRVEIARLLFHGARLLVCDEPTAVLAPPEVEALFRVFRRFREEGRSVVFITHKLAEVLEMADRVTVLRKGRVVGESARGEFDRARLVRWIVGEEERPARAARGPAAGAGVASAAPAPTGAAEPAVGRGAGSPGGPTVSGRSPTARETSGSPAVSVDGLTVLGSSGRPALVDATFELRPGEILGIAGVQGNGQRELAEALAGRRLFARGTIRIAGRSIAAGRPMPADVRPAFVPEDRHDEGLLPGMPLWENLLLTHLDDAAVVHRGWYRHGEARRWALPLLTRFRVDPVDPQAVPEALSGGNQQKLLCARELSRRRDVLVAAQPTRGVDLASTDFLHGVLRRFRDEGGSVLLVSADLDEILALSDRVAVLYRGRLSPPQQRDALDLARLGRAMMGLSADMARG